MKINLKSLCPTIGAANQHSRRVFCQIQTWLGEDGTISYTDWGWRAEKQNLFPVLTDEPLIPAILLKRFYCGLGKAVARIVVVGKMVKLSTLYFYTAVLRRNDVSQYEERGEDKHSIEEIA